MSERTQRKRRSRKKRQELSVEVEPNSTIPSEESKAEAVAEAGIDSVKEQVVKEEIFSPGTYVSVKHVFSFKPEYANERDYGVIDEIYINEGYVAVAFPVDNIHPLKESRAGFYYPNELKRETKENALKHLPPIWVQVDPLDLIR